MPGTQDFNIRYLKPSDFTRICEMADTMVGQIFAGERVDTDTIQSLVNDSVDVDNRRLAGIILVDKEDVPQGFIFACVNPLYFHPREVATCMTVWVEPDARAHGLDLLRAFEAWAKYKEADILSVSSFAAISPKALGTVYNRLGYTLQEHSYWKEL